MQCVKQNFLPLLYLVDQRAKSMKVWDFGVSNIFFESFNLRMTKEWVNEIRTCPRVENLTEFEDRT